MNKKVEPGSHVVIYISLLLQLFSAAGSEDTVFVTLFPTTVDRASCTTHRLPCPCWLFTTLMERVSTRVVVVEVRELLSLVTSTICVRIRGHMSEAMRIVYHMAHIFVYYCILTTVDS